MSLSKRSSQGKPFDPEYQTSFSHLLRIGLFLAGTEKHPSLRSNSSWKAEFSASCPRRRQSAHRGSIHRNEAPLWYIFLDRPWSRSPPAWLPPPSRDEPFLSLFWSMWREVSIRTIHSPDGPYSGRNDWTCSDEFEWYSSLQPWPIKQMRMAAILHKCPRS